MITKPALGIAVEILFERHEQKDCNGKTVPQGNVQIKKSKTALLIEITLSQQNYVPNY